MERKEFNEKVLELVKIYMPERISSQGKLVLNKQGKLNDTVLWGIMLEPENGKVTPIVYLEELYEDYMQGVSIIDLAKKFVKVYERAWDEKPDVNRFDFKIEKIKASLSFKVVNTSKNREMLKSVMHKIIDEDFSIVYYVEIAEGAYFNITKDFAKGINLDLEEMHSIAMVNTPKQFPVVFDKMKKFFEENYSSMYTEGMSDRFYIVTNEKKYYGASAIFYPGVIEQISKTLGGDFYAIPSSVHEWLIFKSDNIDEPLLMENTIESGNKNFCHSSEILADHLYMYDSRKKEFKKWKTP